jgi:3-hydroxyisobutyrate dehydrogenase-like beta-hydroxyacid dehydrogenase
MSNPRIGFIGIGMMGHGMARNLVAKGFPLTFLVHRTARASRISWRGCQRSEEPARWRGRATS